MTQNQPNEPILSAAPRMGGSGASLRYEFRTLDDLIECLENGTFVLRITAKESGDFETDKKLFIDIKGQFSDGQAGQIYVALRANTITERSYGNYAASFYYDLLKNDNPRYEELKNKSDTWEAYSKFMKFAGAQLNTIRVKHFPDYSDTLHEPFFLKLSLAKMAVVKEKTWTSGDATEKSGKSTETFNMGAFQNQPGRLMVKLTNPWMWDQKAAGNKLLGIQCVLARFKYLTDAEKNVQVAKLALIKKNKEIKRSREAGTQFEPAQKKGKEGP